MWKDLDFKNGRGRLTGNKPRIPRNLPLWPETVKALKELPRTGHLVFHTSEGHPWIRIVIRINNGDRKYISINRITPIFLRLMKKVEIHAPKGTAFYSLRRTAATLAARSGNRLQFKDFSAMLI